MRPLLALCTLLLAGACASTGHDPRDPWEPLNRKTYAFNEALDRAVMRPAAEAYVKVAPAYLRGRVNDFFGNIADIGTGLNDFLQGKAREGINDFGRIVVNTTFGIAGFWDVASRVGVEKRDEDFGQTLGVWGVPPGPYFVIPLLGPSSARDAPARVADPSWYYSRYIDDDVYWGMWTLDAVRTRANLLKASNILEQAALDPYIFTRDAWLDRRRNQVYDGKPPLEDDEKDQK